MFRLSNLSISKTVVAAANIPETDSSSLQSNAPKPHPVPTRKAVTLPGRKKLQPLSPQPSLVKIERIVGAGSFRDGEPQGDSEQRKSVFDLFWGNQFEGPVEKKLRETGEWLVTNTENEFRSAGKGILIFAFQWVLPIWVLSLLVAFGIIKLPFSTPLLDDLLM
ncbi:hypothetical protein L6164_026711 [Bauhinia variegata]|uniref:Uncharacterized protein n=1 Tax=Bauhinia variegata TaxID=167791 RepID=A0ACB9LQX7_BAUVA|nr:hypothetical protein L6164_026711 [Bauhinia variegata]